MLRPIRLPDWSAFLSTNLLKAGLAETSVDADVTEYLIHTDTLRDTAGEARVPRLTHTSHKADTAHGSTDDQWGTFKNLKRPASAICS